MSNTLFVSKVILALVAVIYCFPNPNSSQLQQGKEYTLRLQPELDRIDITHYLKNERLIRLQIKCLLYEGPCDIVGRWAKPRVKAGLLGECLLCSEKQKEWLNTWLQVLIDKFPDFYRAAVAKYIHSSGIELSPEEYEFINRTFSDDALNKAAVIFSTVDDKNQKIKSVEEVENSSFLSNTISSATSTTDSIIRNVSTSSNHDLKVKVEVKLFSPADVYGDQYIQMDRILMLPQTEIVSHNDEKLERRKRNSDRGPPSSYSSSSRNSDSAQSIPRLAPPPPGTVLTYDGRTVRTNDGGISLMPSSDRRTPSIRNRPQYAPYRGDLPPPIPDYVPSNLPQLGPQNPNRPPKSSGDFSG